MKGAPDCYRCAYRGDLPGDAHSRCAAITARVTGNAHGKQMGWFMWPFNFDPVWLDSCDSFRPIDTPKEAA